SDGRYNISLWRLWAEKKGKKPVKKRLSEKADLEAEHVRLKNEKLEMENAIRRGQLLDLDEGCRVLTELMEAMVRRLRGAKDTLAPEVVGLSIPEATKRIR